MTPERDDLPPYRFGIDPGPHPTRHPDGHSYGERGFVDDRAAFDRGVVLFDHGFYWEAHEAWEGPWRRAARESPARSLWQALILLAAAALKRQRGEHDATARLARKACTCIARAEHAGGRRLLAVDTRRLRQLAVQLAGRARAEDRNLRLGGPG